MFWDFGSLHKKPRVGGTHGCVRRDGSRCMALTGSFWGNNTGVTRWFTSSANHRLLGPGTGSEVRSTDLLGVAGKSRTSRWIFPASLRVQLCSGTSVRSTLRRCGVLAGDCCGSGKAQQVRRSSVKELASVQNGVSLIDRLQRSFAESFIWQLARMKSKSCPCSPSRRLSCDRVTHRRVLTKFVELSPRVAVITLRCSLLWQSMMFKCIKAGREHQLGPSVDTRTCVSFRYMYVLFTAVLHVAVALRKFPGTLTRRTPCSPTIGWVFQDLRYSSSSLSSSIQREICTSVNGHGYFYSRLIGMGLVLCVYTVEEYSQNFEYRQRLDDGSSPVRPSRCCWKILLGGMSLHTSTTWTSSCYSFVFHLHGCSFVSSPRKRPDFRKDS